MEKTRRKLFYASVEEHTIHVSTCMKPSLVTNSNSLLYCWQLVTIPAMDPMGYVLDPMGYVPLYIGVMCKPTLSTYLLYVLNWTCFMQLNRVFCIPFVINTFVSNTENCREILLEATDKVIVNVYCSVNWSSRSTKLACMNCYFTGEAGCLFWVGW